MVRPVRAGDGAACAALWTEFGRALAERDPGFREPEQEGLADWFERAIADVPPHALRLIAEAEGAAIGLAHARIRAPQDPPGPALIRAALATRLVLEDIVVARGWRDRGAGTLLLRHVETWGRERGAASMMLNSHAEGPARRFYERDGFAIIGALYGKDL